jgi:hypothetical protein
MKTNAIAILICVTTFCIGTSLVAGPNQSNQKGMFAHVDAQRLAGQWLRPDGGYVLQLTNIRDDGGLKANYFNPNPINVHRAKWGYKDRMVNLFVELRDVNYPGSIYRLRYDGKADRLKGTYFQALLRQTFDVEFVRVKAKTE